MTRHPLSCRGCGRLRGVTSISVNSYAYYSVDCVPVTRERFTISTGIYRSLRTRSETWRFSDVTSQLVINCNASQAQISRTSRVPLLTVTRCVKLYRQCGVRALFRTAKAACRPENSLLKCVSRRKCCSLHNVDQPKVGAGQESVGGGQDGIQVPEGFVMRSHRQRT